MSKLIGNDRREAEAEVWPWEPPNPDTTLPKAAYAAIRLTDTIECNGCTQTRRVWIRVPLGEAHRIAGEITQDVAKAILDTAAAREAAALRRRR